MKYLAILLVVLSVCFGSIGCSGSGVPAGLEDIEYLDVDLADLADVLMNKDRADDLAYYNDQKYLRVQGSVTGIFTLNNQRQFFIKPVDDGDTSFLVSGAMNDGFDPLFDGDDPEIEKLAEDTVITLEGEFIGRTYSMVAEEGKFNVHTIIYNGKSYSLID